MHIEIEFKESEQLYVANALDNEDYPTPTQKFAENTLYRLFKEFELDCQEWRTCDYGEHLTSSNIRVFDFMDTDLVQEIIEQFYKENIF